MSHSGSPIQQGDNLFGDQPVNPYAAPQYSEGMVGDAGGRTAAQFKLIKDFRSQSLALGVAWCLIAGLCVLLAVFFSVVTFARGPEALSELPPLAMACISVFFGVLWLVSGVFTLMKQLWAVWLGTILCGVIVVGNLLNLNICGLAIAGILLWQGIRVIFFANDMTRQGIPLDEKA